MASQDHCFIMEMPVELVSYVFSFLDLHPDIFNLCESSRGFRKLTEPYIYKCFESYNWNSCTKFLEAILAHPGASSHTKELGTILWSFEDPMLPPGDNIVPDQSKERFIEAVNKFEVPFKERWLNELDEMEDTAIIALLISQLPNLKKLHLIEPRIGVEKNLFADFLESQYGPRSRHPQRLFQALEVLEISHWRYPGRRTNLDCFFTLNSLEQFYAYQCKWGEGIPLQVFGASNSSKITTLDFKESSICPHAMCAFIQACTALKTFRYTSGLLDTTSPGPLCPKHLIDSLWKHRRTLTTLQIWISLYQDDNRPWESDETMIHSMADFESLTTIDINAKCILDLSGDLHPDELLSRRQLDQILPRSIRKLALGSNNNSIIPYLETFARDLNEKFRCLQAIELFSFYSDHTFHLQHAFYDAILSCDPILKPTFAEKRVNLEYRTRKWGCHM